MESNVIVAADGIRVENAGAVATWKGNLFFSRGGQYQGVPEGEARADPLFIDPEKGDYRFKLDSPAARLGIKTLDFSHVGPRRTGGQ